MISLQQIILDDKRLTIWQTAGGQWAGMNRFGKIRYFNDRESALAFIHGAGAPRKHYHTQNPERREKVQGDDRTDIDVLRTEGEGLEPT